VLAYYAIANASAWTLPARHARGARVVPAAGLVGCVTLAATLPAETVAAGAAVLAAGAAVWRLPFGRRRGRRSEPMRD
jgi:basic amino acid/polyamine antiporter, APA family